MYAISGICLNMYTFQELVHYYPYIHKGVQEQQQQQKENHKKQKVKGHLHWGKNTKIRPKAIHSLCHLPAVWAGHLLPLGNQWFLKPFITWNFYDSKARSLSQMLAPPTNSLTAVHRCSFLVIFIMWWNNPILLQSELWSAECKAVKHF